MNRITSAALILLLLACTNEAVEQNGQTATTATTALPGAAQPPKLGDAAPDFALTDQAGKPVRLSDARGDKVVLVFYRGHW